MVVVRLGLQEAEMEVLSRRLHHHHHPGVVVDSAESVAEVRQAEDRCEAVVVAAEAAAVAVEEHVVLDRCVVEVGIAVAARSPTEFPLVFIAPSVLKEIKANSCLTRELL